MRIGLYCGNFYYPPPTVTQWYQETFKVLPMERLSAILRFHNMWQPSLDDLPRDLVVFVC